VLSPSFFGRESGGPRALRIMPAGDSLTRGSSGWPKDDPRGGYRGPLWARLAGQAVDFVGTARGGPHAIDRDHESWDGITVEELAGKLFADLPAQAPDVILLHIGTNDVLHGHSPDLVAGRLAALIDGIVARAPRTQLLVASLVGVRVPNAYHADPEAIAAVNARLHATVADRAGRGEKVRFVDLHARVGRSAADFADDGLHLSERGYREMAEAWLEALRHRP